MSAGNPRLDQFVFLDEGTARTRFLDSLSRVVTRVFGTTPLLSPVAFREGGPDRPLPTLREIGSALGFDRPEDAVMLDYHRDRLRSRRKLRDGYSAPIGSGIILALVLAVVGILWLLGGVKDPFGGRAFEGFTGLSAGMKALSIAMSIFLMYVVSGVGMKVGTILTDRQFADTLCLYTLLYLLLELERPDVLTRSERRRAVHERVNHLARGTILLGLQFSSPNPMMREWQGRHFAAMKLFIRERERWFSAPRETTLDDLRRDFRSLASLHLTGHYGGFQWAEAPADSAPSPRPASGLVVGLSRLVGIVIPVLGLGLLLGNAAVLRSFGAQGNVVLVILVAWLMLAVDAALKLGLVSGIVALAKDIKQLK